MRFHRILLALIPALAALGTPAAHAEEDANALGYYVDEIVRYGADSSRTDRYHTTANSSTLSWGEAYVLRVFLEAYNCTEDPYWLERISTHADSIFAQARDVPEGAPFDTSVYQDGYLGWGTDAYSEGYDEYMVHDGHFTGPIAAYLSYVFADSSLWDQFGTRAQRQYEFLRDNVAAKWMPYLDGDMVRDSDDWTQTMRNWRGFDYMPYNQYSAFGTFLLFMDDVERTAKFAELYPGGGHEKYRQHAVAMGEHFKAALKLTDEDGYRWSYGWTSGAEDISHANLELEFAVYLHERGLVFDLQDMHRFGRTVTNVLWNGSLDSPGFSKNVDGEGDYEWSDRLWGFSLFSRYDPYAWYLMALHFHQRVHLAGETINTSYINIAMARLHRLRTVYDTTGILLPVGVIVRDNGNRSIEPGETVELELFVENVGRVTDSALVRVFDIAPLTPVGPDDALVTAAPGSTVSARLQVTAPSDVGTESIQILLGAGQRRTRGEIMLGSPNVLWVQHPPIAGHEAEDAFMEYLYLDVPPLIWQKVHGDTISSDLMGTFEHVIWRCGRGLPSEAERDELAAYLDAGGKLLITGGGVFAEWISRSEADSVFLANYLRITDASVLGDSVADHKIRVEPRDIERLSAIGSSQTLRSGTKPDAARVALDVFETGQEDALLIDLEVTDLATNERINDPGSVVGIGIDSSYAALVFGWDFSDVESLFGPWRTVVASLSWLEEPVAVDATNSETPERFSLAAYPNPFNPRTTLVIQGLVPGEPVRLRVANTVGQIVMDREMTAQAPTMSVPWHGFDRAGRRLGSGVYLLSVEQEERRAVRKVLLVR